MIGLGDDEYERLVALLMSMRDQLRAVVPSPHERKEAEASLRRAFLLLGEARFRDGLPVEIRRPSPAPRTIYVHGTAPEE